MSHDRDHDSQILPPRDPGPPPFSSPKPDRTRPEHPRPDEPEDPKLHPERER